MVDRKGLNLLLDALDDQYDLIVCGSGDFETAKPNVYYRGQVSRDEMLEFYQAVDMFVLPSHSEGFPLAAEEAAACGLPLIVSNSEEFHNFLDESTAVFVDRSEQDIARGIRLLAGNKILMSSMGKAARQCAVKNFDCRQTSSKYLQLYKTG